MVIKEDDRLWSVKQLLFDYVKSPSLRHIRDPHSMIQISTNSHFLGVISYSGCRITTFRLAMF